MPVAVSMTLPEPTSSTLILLLARPGPEPTLIWNDSTAMPTACRSTTTPAPGRICSTYDRYGSSAASPLAGISGVQVYTKFGPPDLTTLPKPKQTAHAPISALRYFSSVHPTSHAVLYVTVGNSWPLPYSSASFSVASFGLMRDALSFVNRHISAATCAVAISACFFFPKQISTSWSLVVDIRLYLLGGGRRVTLAPASDHKRRQNSGRCFDLLRIAHSERRLHPDLVRHHSSPISVNVMGTSK